MRTSKQHSFDDKWPRSVADAGHTQVPNLLLRHIGELGINTTEALVLIELISYYWKKDDKPWPSAKTLADMTGSSVGTIRRAWKNLEEAHLIKRVMRIGASNEFDLKPLIERMEIIAKANPPPRKQGGYSNMSTPHLSHSSTPPSTKMGTKVYETKYQYKKTHTNGFENPAQILGRTHSNKWVKSTTN